MNKIKYSLFTFISLVYLLSLSQGPMGGDSNEWILIAGDSTGAIPHPPGYPLYFILLKISSFLLFFLSPPLVASLLSALFMIGTLFIFWKWQEQQTPVIPSISKVLTTLALAFCPLVFEYATIPEVFTLNLLLVMSFLYFYFQKKTLPMAFLTGLFICHHHTALIFSFPLWCFYLYENKYYRQINLKKCSLAFALGLSPLLVFFYYATILNSSDNHYVAWAYLEKGQDFIDYLLRKRYGTLSLTKEQNDFSNLITMSFVNLKNSLWILITNTLGLCFLIFTRPFRLKPLGIALLSYSLFFICLANIDTNSSSGFTVYSRFWLLPLLILFMYFALLLRNKVALTLMLLICTLPALKVFVTVPASLFDDYYKTTLQQLPSHSIILTKGDLAYNGLIYQQQIKGLRRDLILFDRSLMSSVPHVMLFRKQHPRVLLPGEYYNPKLNAIESFNLKDLLSSNSSNYTFFSFPFTSSELENREPSAWQKNFPLLPRGLVSEFSRQEDSFNQGSFADFLKQTEGAQVLMEKYQKYYLRQTSPWNIFFAHSWERVLFEDLLSAQKLRLQYLSYQAQKLSGTALSPSKSD